MVSDEDLAARTGYQLTCWTGHVVISMREIRSRSSDVAVIQWRGLTELVGRSLSPSVSGNLRAAATSFCKGLASCGGGQCARGCRFVDNGNEVTRTQMGQTKENNF
jgi:hypothetical protein